MAFNASMSRRSLIAAASAVAACATVAASAAGAEEAAEITSDTPDWLGAAPEILDVDCAEVVDVEILVVGAGCSGIPCAVSAAEAGAKVLLIDRMEKGFGIRCSALGAVDSVKQREQGVVIDKNEIVNDLVHYANGNCDMRLWKMWADESGEAISWYCDHADKTGAIDVELEWNMPQGTRYNMWPTGHATMGREMKWAGEPIMLDYFIDYLNSFEGCEHRGYTKLERLIVEEGAVVGAYCSTGEDFDRMIRVNASKGVVIATGGYVLNGDMMSALQPETLAGLAGFFTSSQVYGEGIKAALWAGAHMQDTHTSLVFDRGVVAPDQELGNPFKNGVINGYNVGSQPWLKVNQFGERFCNESSPYDYVFYAASKFPNHAWYPVWDANYCEDMYRFQTIGCSTQFAREGGDLLMGGDEDMVRGGLEQRVEAGQVVKADTLEELAEKLGLPVDTFLATVARHNEMFDAQLDEDFGKEPFRLSGMKDAPFYGMKLGGIALCTFDGVCVNTDLQAVDAQGNAIEGLYLVGNDAGNLYNKNYLNFAAGVNAGRCVTQGRHVGLALAAQ